MEDMEQYLDRLIQCVGADDKLHVCLPEDDTTHCGANVKRKKLLKNDYKLHNCIACSF